MLKIKDTIEIVKTLKDKENQAIKNLKKIGKSDQEIDFILDIVFTERVI